MLFDGTYERLYNLFLEKNEGDHDKAREDFIVLGKTIGVAPDRFVNEMMSYLPRRRKHEQL